MSGVFLTGATGNVGSRLIKEYIDTTDATLFLLVRGDSDEAARERIDAILDFWEVDKAIAHPRIVVLRGDILEAGLGLDEAQAERVRREVQTVIHVASNLRLDMDIDRARAEILHATQAVFALAQSLDELKMFGYSSTMEVMGRYRGEVKEESIADYGVPFCNTYEIAKFETEEWLLAREKEGHPVVIFRISMVVGETGSGKVPRFQSFYMLTEKLILQPDFAVLPRRPPIDAIPLDFLTRCIHRIVETPSLSGRVLHLSQGLDDYIEFPDFRTMVSDLAKAELGWRPKPAMLIWPGIHRGLFRLLSWVTFGKTRRFFRVQLIFLKFFDLPGTFDNPQTRAAMAEQGLEWPRFRDYAPTLIRYYFKRRDDNRLPF